MWRYLASIFFWSSVFPVLGNSVNLKQNFFVGGLQDIHCNISLTYHRLICTMFLRCSRSLGTDLSLLLHIFLESPIIINLYLWEETTAVKSDYVKLSIFHIRATWYKINKVRCGPIALRQWVWHSLEGDFYLHKFINLINSYTSLSACLSGKTLLVWLPSDP